MGEELDAHRKERQAQHPKLTLTQMYNTLEKLRAGEGIEGRDKQVYEDGLVGLLKDIHDRIDSAVAEAYGWPEGLSENDILMNLPQSRARRRRGSRPCPLASPRLPEPRGSRSRGQAGQARDRRRRQVGQGPLAQIAPRPDRRRPRGAGGSRRGRCRNRRPHLPARPRQVRRAFAGNARGSGYGRDDRRGPLCHLTAASSSSPKACLTWPA